jgi:hypothetical protein
VVAERIGGLLAEGRDAHPAPASTDVPPGPDLDAPDINAPAGGVPHAAGAHPAEPSGDGSPPGAPDRGVDRMATDPRVIHEDGITGAVSPIEGVAELLGIDDEAPGGSNGTDGDREVGRRH